MRIQEKLLCSVHIRITPALPWLCESEVGGVPTLVFPRRTLRSAQGTIFIEWEMRAEITTESHLNVTVRKGRPRLIIIIVGYTRRRCDLQMGLGSVGFTPHFSPVAPAAFVLLHFCLPVIEQLNTI